MCPHYGKYYAQSQLGEYKLATQGLPGATSPHEISQSCLIPTWGGTLQGLAVHALPDSWPHSPLLAQPLQLSTYKLMQDAPANTARAAQVPIARPMLPP